MSMSALASINFYSVLEIPQHASQTEIDMAFQKACTTYSLQNPEIYKVFSQSEALEWNRLVEDAYQTLGHPARREIYNQELSNHSRIVPSNLEEFSLESEKGAPPIGFEQDRPSAKQNFDKTSLSQYQVSPEMEAAIETQEVFDGLFLKKIRTYKQVDLQDFVRKTCIAQRHIYAIENNNFSVLPAPVFVRGYIVQYCKLLNLDEKKVVPSFMALLSDDHHSQV